MSNDTLARWTAIQLKHSADAQFTDDADCIQVGTNGISAGEHLPFFEFAEEDWDDPAVPHINPDDIVVRGIEHVAGVDISYRIGSEGEGVVALVILEYPTMKLKHTFMKPIKVTEPYIPSYLSMRELEHVLMIYDEAVKSLPPDTIPQVVFVDGLGRWHERQAGLATALGVERDIRTIGVGKEYQPLRPDLGSYIDMQDPPIPMPPWPEVEHWRLKQKDFRTMTRKLLRRRGDMLGVPLYKGGPVIGAAVYTAPGTLHKDKPLPLPSYISPGHRISLETAIALTMTCCIRDFSRLPEPIILADRLGRDEVKRLWG